MRNIIRIVLIVIVLFIAFVQSRPATFHVERSATLAASPSAVYSHLVHFHDWAAWSPWEKLDPQMKKDFSGPDSGVGAYYHWSGNKQVGEGSMKITDAATDSKVVIALEFLAPFKSSNMTTFALAPEGEGTKVTWSMDGRNNFMSKFMCLFMSMDKMIGPDFERGLAQLGTAAAVAPADSAAAPPAKS
jgi:hypothetical protein